MERKKVLEFLVNPRITPVQFLFSMVSILIFIFIGTNAFEGISDGWKIVVYVAFTTSAALAGFNFSASKAVDEIRQVYFDSKLEPWEKVKKIGGIIIQGMIKLGKAWEEVNEEQFPEKEELPES